MRRFARLIVYPLLHSAFIDSVAGSGSRAVKTTDNLCPAIAYGVNLYPFAEELRRS